MTTFEEYREQFLQLDSKEKLEIALRRAGMAEVFANRIRELWEDMHKVTIEEPVDPAPQPKLDPVEEKPEMEPKPTPLPPHVDPVDPLAEETVEHKIMRKVIDETFMNSR